MRQISISSDSHLNYHDMLKIVMKRVTDYNHIKHVHKSLVLIEFLLMHGPERFRNDVSVRTDVIRKLTAYKYFKEGAECGDEVRRRASDILAIIDDSEKMNAPKNHVVHESHLKNRLGSPVKQRRALSPVVEELKEREDTMFSDEEPATPSPVKAKKAPRRKQVVVKSPKKEAPKSYIVKDNSCDLLDLMNFNSAPTYNNRPAIMAPEWMRTSPFADQDKKQMILYEAEFDPVESALFDIAEEDVMVDDQVEEVVQENNKEDEINDPWDFINLHNVSNIRQTKEDVESRNYVQQRKAMMKDGPKLKDMAPVHQMEFEPTQTFANNNSQAVVPLGYYTQHQMYYQYPAQELQWN